MDANQPTAEREQARFSRRQLLIGGALLATAGASYAMTPRSTIDLFGEGDLDKMIPARIGGWTFQSKSGLVLPPSDQLLDRLYDQLLTRVYLAPDLPPVMLLIAQSPKQDGVLQIHRPEVCYPAGGYRISETRVRQVDLAGGRALPIRSLTAESPSRTEHLLYWTRVGHSLPTSWAQQRLAVAKANLRGQIPDGVLVRLSTIGSSWAASVPMLDDFTRALISSASPRTRLALIGA